jgi:hypothetical protein
MPFRDGKFRYRKKKIHFEPTTMPTLESARLDSTKKFAIQCEIFWLLGNIFFVERKDNLSIVV